jgi:hypothetical protein
MKLNRIARPLIAALLLAGIPAVAPAANYRGIPHLHLTAAVLNAGGGRSAFSSHHLVPTLAGLKYAAENAKLNRQYGIERVNDFYRVFTFAIDDSSEKAGNFLIPLPKTAKTDPSDARALAQALYRAGLTPSGRCNVGFMLEVLICIRSTTISWSTWTRRLGLR